jgi:hypothetical protein
MPLPVALKRKTDAFINLTGRRNGVLAHEYELTVERAWRSAQNCDGNATADYRAKLGTYAAELSSHLPENTKRLADVDAHDVQQEIAGTFILGCKCQKR